MKKESKTLKYIIKLIDLYGYLAAFYEILIKHNLGLGVILTLVSFILSLTIILIDNLEKLKLYIETNFSPKSISSIFKAITIIHIFSWLTLLFLFSHKGASAFSVLFFGFLLYNMPIIFTTVTIIFCYLTQENKNKYLDLTVIVSIVLSIILLLIFILCGTSIPWLIFEIICQIIPFFIMCELFNET